MKDKFVSINQEWQTPDNIFQPLNNEFHFQIDLAGSQINKRCERVFTKTDDTFKQNWQGICWLNPEFKTVKKWVKKAYEDSEKFNSTIVVLVLSKTNTNWWRDYVMKAKEVRFINQKIRFKAIESDYNGKDYGLAFPACIVVFQKHEGVTKFSMFESTQMIHYCLPTLVNQMENTS